MHWSLVSQGSNNFFEHATQTYNWNHPSPAHTDTTTLTYRSCKKATECDPPRLIVDRWPSDRQSNKEKNLSSLASPTTRSQLHYIYIQATNSICLQVTSVRSTHVMFTSLSVLFSPLFLRSSTRSIEIARALLLLAIRISH